MTPHLLEQAGVVAYTDRTGADMKNDNAYCPTMPVVTMLAEVPLATYTDRLQVSSPDEAYEVIRPLMEGLDREIAVLVSLDTKHRVLAIDTVTMGTVDHTFLAPREIFRSALYRGASAIFLAHNHPSGDPTPSTEDRQVTRRLAQVGTTLGIDLLDHIVVGDTSFTSLARLGVL